MIPFSLKKKKRKKVAEAVLKRLLLNVECFALEGINDLYDYMFVFG